MIQDFAARLLAWFDRHGRHDLPWQQSINPYRVWISEIMLQQTQVSTVIPYFERFMQSFPTLADLAKADEESVLHLWTGLGYYARARNLHKTARLIQEKHHGLFPNQLEQLEALPGIGRSTAGAILSIAFQQRAPILDGNVRRVLTRLYAIEGTVSDKNTQNLLWNLADQHTPEKRVADYTQAIMDLGATLCTRSQPQCSACPFQTECLAFHNQQTHAFPQRQTKKALPIKKSFLVLLSRPSGEILLEKRPSNGIWGGLWSLPEYTGEESDLTNWIFSKYGFSLESLPKKLPAFRHTFTHFHWDITPYQLAISSCPLAVSENDQQSWFDPQKPKALGLPAPIKKLLENTYTFNAN